MKKYHEILVKVICISNTINKLGKKPRDFGISCMLYPAEIHTIEAIGACEEINANSLSKALGITNGAVTQMTDKLIKKGLVEKYKIESNKKEVYFKLTELGKAADQGHDNFHEQTYTNIIGYLDRLKPNQVRAIEDFLEIYIKNLPSE